MNLFDSSLLEALVIMVCNALLPVIIPRRLNLLWIKMSLPWNIKIWTLKVLTRHYVMAGFFGRKKTTPKNRDIIKTQSHLFKLNVNRELYSLGFKEDDTNSWFVQGWQYNCHVIWNSVPVQRVIPRLPYIWWNNKICLYRLIPAHEDAKLNTFITNQGRFEYYSWCSSLKFS